jgi:hypothetical protein
MAREPISEKQRRQLEAKTRLGRRIQPKEEGGGHRPSAGTVIDEVSTYAKDTKFVLWNVTGEGRDQGEWYRLCSWTHRFSTALGLARLEQRPGDLVYSLGPCPTSSPTRPVTGTPDPYRA